MPLTLDPNQSVEDVLAPEQPRRQYRSVPVDESGAPLSGKFRSISVDESGNPLPSKFRSIPVDETGKQIRVKPAAPTADEINAVRQRIAPAKEVAPSVLQDLAAKVGQPIRFSPEIGAAITGKTTIAPASSPAQVSAGLPVFKKPAPDAPEVLRRLVERNLRGAETGDGILGGLASAVSGPGGATKLVPFSNLMPGKVDFGGIAPEFSPFMYPGQAAMTPDRPANAATDLAALDDLAQKQKSGAKLAPLEQAALDSFGLYLRNQQAAGAVKLTTEGLAGLPTTLAEFYLTEPMAESVMPPVLGKLATARLYKSMTPATIAGIQRGGKVAQSLARGIGGATQFGLTTAIKGGGAADIAQSAALGGPLGALGAAVPNHAARALVAMGYGAAEPLAAAAIQGKDVREAIPQAISQGAQFGLLEGLSLLPDVKGALGKALSTDRVEDLSPAQVAESLAALDQAGNLTPDQLRLQALLKDALVLAKEQGVTGALGIQVTGTGPRRGVPEWLRQKLGMTESPDNAEVVGGKKPSKGAGAESPEKEQPPHGQVAVINVDGSRSETSSGKLAQKTAVRLNGANEFDVLALGHWIQPEEMRGVGEAENPAALNELRVEARRRALDELNLTPEEKAILLDHTQDNTTQSQQIRASAVPLLQIKAGEKWYRSVFTRGLALGGDDAADWPSDLQEELARARSLLLQGMSAKFTTPTGRYNLEKETLPRRLGMLEGEARFAHEQTKPAGWGSTVEPARQADPLPESVAAANRDNLTTLARMAGENSSRGREAQQKLLELTGAATVEELPDPLKTEIAAGRLAEPVDTRQQELEYLQNWVAEVEKLPPPDKANTSAGAVLKQRSHYLTLAKTRIEELQSALGQHDTERDKTLLGVTAGTEVEGESPTNKASGKSMRGSTDKMTKEAAGLPAFIGAGPSAAEQQLLRYADRRYFHGISGRRLEALLNTGQIPDARQAFGGSFSITDDFEYAKQHAGKDGKVIELRLDPRADVKEGSQDAVNDIDADLVDSGEGEFIVHNPSRISIIKESAGEILPVAAQENTEPLGPVAPWRVSQAEWAGPAPKITLGLGQASDPAIQAHHARQSSHRQAVERALLAGDLEKAGYDQWHGAAYGKYGSTEFNKNFGEVAKSGTRVGGTRRYGIWRRPGNRLVLKMPAGQPDFTQSDTPAGRKKLEGLVESLEGADRFDALAMHPDLGWYSDRMEAGNVGQAIMQSRNNFGDKTALARAREAAALAAGADQATAKAAAGDTQKGIQTRAELANKLAEYSASQGVDAGQSITDVQSLARAFRELGVVGADGKPLTEREAWLLAAVWKRVADFMDVPLAHLVGRAENLKPTKIGVRFSKGAMALDADLNAYILRLAAGRADPSTAVHELAHIVFAELLAQDHPLARTVLDVYRAETGRSYDHENHTEEQYRHVQEWYAKKFEQYWAERADRAKTGPLRRVFATVQKWMGAIYRSVEKVFGREKLDPKLREVFDALLSKRDRDQSSNPSVNTPDLNGPTKENPSTGGKSDQVLPPSEETQSLGRGGRLKSETTGSEATITESPATAKESAESGAGAALIPSTKTQPTPEVKADTKELPEPAKVPGEVQDFGEKLGGARKDQVASAAKEISDADLVALSFSEIWPKGEVDAIENPDQAALATVLRSVIPAKPRKGYKVQRWVEQVKIVRTLMQYANEHGFDAVMAKMNEGDYQRALGGFREKVNLLRQLPRAEWDRIGRVVNYPDAYQFEKDADGQLQRTPTPHASAEVDGQWVSAPSLEELRAKVAERLGAAAESAAMQFEIRYNSKTGDAFINKKGDPLYRKLKEFTGKDAIAQAKSFLKQNRGDLAAAWEAIKKTDNVKETDVRRAANRPRTAKDYREGKDVTPEMFQGAFGFRGVEFGNWVEQGANRRERQGMLNEAFDALHDLAEIIGVPPKALSLNGELGLGFGSRGSGKASAHYEPGKIVINLTKTRGAGALAHEWFHALDHYFQRQRIGQKSTTPHGGNMITYQPEAYYEHGPTGQRLSATRFTQVRVSNPSEWRRIEGVRPEVEQAFSDLVNALNDSPMNKRSQLIDAGKSGGYWSRIIERAARSFENYVIAKMQQQGYHNDYLANVATVEQFQRDPNRYPYLLESEIQPVAEAFDKLFDTLETKETDKGIALYQTEEDESRPVEVVKSRQNVTLNRDLAVARALLDHDGGKRPVKVGPEQREFYISRKRLDKMTAPFDRDGKPKKYVKERIAAIQSLDELAAVAVPRDERVDLEDPSHVAKVFEYVSPFEYGGKVYRARLLAKEFKPETKQTDKLHSLAIEDVIVEDVPADQLASSGNETGVKPAGLTGSEAPDAATVRTRSTVTIGELLGRVKPAEQDLEKGVPVAQHVPADFAKTPISKESLQAAGFADAAEARAAFERDGIQAAQETFDEFLQRQHCAELKGRNNFSIK